MIVKLQIRNMFGHVDQLKLFDYDYQPSDNSLNESERNNIPIQEMWPQLITIFDRNRVELQLIS